MAKPTKQETSEEMIRRAQTVARIIDTQEFKDAVEAIEHRTIQQWREARDSIAREALHAKLSALDAIVEELRTVFERGQTEAAFVARRTPRA